MNQLVKSMKHGVLTYDNYATITRPIEVGRRTDGTGYVNVLDLDTSRLNTLSRKAVIKARKHKARKIIMANGGFNKVNKRYIRKLIKEQRVKYKRTQGTAAANQVSVGYRAMGKARKFKINNNDDNVLNNYRSVPDKEETAWMVNVIISPNGQISIPEFDSESGALHTANTAKTAAHGVPCDTRTALEKAALNILKLYPSTDINNIKIESDIVYNIYNSKSDVLVRCNVPPDNINKCCPKVVDWRDKLIDGKIKRFDCMNPDVKFNPLASDIPHKIEIKDGMAIPTPH